jgi:hypothetical protein
MPIYKLLIYKAFDMVSYIETCFLCKAFRHFYGRLLQLSRRKTAEEKGAFSTRKEGGCPVDYRLQYCSARFID